MKFEEALSELRKGKKIRHPHFKENEYLMGCYVSMKFSNESLEDAKLRGMSITWTIGDKIHPNMYPKFPRECGSDLHNFPQLNLFYIMSDQWECVENLK